MAVNGVEDIAWPDLVWDVVVIGGGNAALSSAMAAHDVGAKVLVLEMNGCSVVLASKPRLLSIIAHRQIAIISANCGGFNLA